jgi:hypothetical protein
MVFRGYYDCGGVLEGDFFGKLAWEISGIGNFF